MIRVAVLQHGPLGNAGPEKCDLVKRSIQNISRPDCLHWFEAEFSEKGERETFGSGLRTGAVIKCAAERPLWQWSRFPKAKQQWINLAEKRTLSRLIIALHLSRHGEQSACISLGMGAEGCTYLVVYKHSFNKACHSFSAICYFFRTTLQK